MEARECEVWAEGCEVRVGWVGDLEAWCKPCLVGALKVLWEIQDGIRTRQKAGWSREEIKHWLRAHYPHSADWVIAKLEASSA